MKWRAIEATHADVFVDGSQLTGGSRFLRQEGARRVEPLSMAFEIDRSNQERLARLEERLAERRQELNQLRRECSAVKERLAAKQRALDDLERQLKRERSRKVTVTDHAIVRYLERVKGLDLQSLAEEMVPDQVVAEIVTGGAGGLYEVGGYQLRVKGGSVTTVTVPHPE